MAFSCRVLLVEHDPDQQLLLAGYLQEQAGLEVLPSTASGREALAYMQTDLPDLMLLDADALDLDGLGVLEALALDGTPASLPILFLMNRRDDRLASAALALGARCVLRRPMELPYLLRRVQMFGTDASPLQLRLRWLGMDRDGVNFQRCRQVAEAMIARGEPQPQMKAVLSDISALESVEETAVAKNVTRAIQSAHALHTDYYRALFGQTEKPPTAYQFLLRLTEGLRNQPSAK